MSRRRIVRNMHEYGSGLHGQHILVEPEVPTPTMYFTNECTGERHPMGSAPTAPVQRMQTFQSKLNGLHRGEDYSWATATPEEILSDIMDWHQKVREGKVYSLAGPWDYLDYRPL